VPFLAAQQDWLIRSLARSSVKFATLLLQLLAARVTIQLSLTQNEIRKAT
jgi:hypothetical protein